MTWGDDITRHDLCFPCRVQSLCQLASVEGLSRHRCLHSLQKSWSILMLFQTITSRSTAMPAQQSCLISNGKGIGVGAAAISIASKRSNQGETLISVCGEGFLSLTPKHAMLKWIIAPKAPYEYRQKRVITSNPLACGWYQIDVKQCQACLQWSNKGNTLQDPLSVFTTLRSIYRYLFLCQLHHWLAGAMCEFDIIQSSLLNTTQKSSVPVLGYILMAISKTWVVHLETYTVYYTTVIGWLSPETLWHLNSPVPVPPPTAKPPLAVSNRTWRCSPLAANSSVGEVKGTSPA